MSTRLHITVSEGLVARIDAARGPGQPRADFIRRAVERALGDERERDGGPAAGANSAETERLASTPERAEHRPSPAPAEQPSQVVQAASEDVIQPRPAGTPGTSPVAFQRGVSPPKPVSPRVPFRRDVKPFQRGGK